MAAGGDPMRGPALVDFETEFANRIPVLLPERPVFVDVVGCQKTEVGMLVSTRLSNITKVVDDRLTRLWVHYVVSQPDKEA
jgi:hypothetical protein